MAPSAEAGSISAIDRMRHIVGLCSIAVTQPVLDALARNSGYRWEAGLQWPEMAGLVALLVVGLPAAAFAVDRLVLRVSSRLRGRGRDSVVICLMLMAALSLLRPLLAHPTLQALSLVWFVTCVIAIGLVGLAIAMYQRLLWFRHWLSFTAWGAVVFPAAFAAQIWQSNTTALNTKSPVTVQNPAPVVLVVFDEFSGLTLMNDDLKFDAQRFPNMAELGQASTWYRNATTVHARTQMAVPAILTGRLPERDRDPEAVNYPGNLFEVIASTGAYDLVACEVYSRLYPRAAQWRSLDRPVGQRFLRLIHTLAAVYPQLLFPRDLGVELIPIPRTWYGLRDASDGIEQTTGRMNLNNLPRHAQLDHFLKCIYPSERPRFYFLHVLLPHYPWCYLPSGQHYLADGDAPLVPESALGELGESWRDDAADVMRWEHRYRLQVGFVDRFLGQLQKRMKEQGIWDSSLLIVTADHGVSFRPGHSRRVPDAETLPDLLSVPLFVKRPGQQVGEQSDRNVETIDIFPTILDVLKIEPRDSVDGSSLLGEASRPRKTFFFQEAMTVVEPDFPAKKRAIQRRQSLFGDEPLSALPAAMSARLSWRGRPISDFAMQDYEASTLEIGKHQLYPDRLRHRFSTALIEGTLSASDLPHSVNEIAIAVDDRIIEVSRLMPVGFGKLGFSILLPESCLRKDRHQVTLFLVPPGDRPTLQRLAAWAINPSGAAADRYKNPASGTVGAQ